MCLISFRARKFLTTSKESIRKNLLKKGVVSVPWAGKGKEKEVKRNFGC